jgi:hypothetical protein
MAQVNKRNIGISTLTTTDNNETKPTTQNCSRETLLSTCRYHTNRTNTWSMRSQFYNPNTDKRLLLVDTEHPSSTRPWAQSYWLSMSETPTLCPFTHVNSYQCLRSVTSTNVNEHAFIFCATMCADGLPLKGPIGGDRHAIPKRW